MNLGEVSVPSKENDHPTCPYCHGAVEEEISILVDVIEIEPKSDRYLEIIENMSELAVNRLFEIISRSLDDSPYSEYKEDIVHLIKDAFEPNAKIAYAEIAHMIYECLRRADAKFDALALRA
ncbi:MAG TPA: hypothetical protein VGK23_10065 [Methanomassiliicoccales archaeon]|jgi:hypothetical protein